MNITAAELAQKVGAEVIGDGSVVLSRVAPLQEAKADAVSFVANPKYIPQLGTSDAGAVIVSRKVRQAKMTLLCVRDPYLAFQQTVVLLHGFRQHPFEGIHPKAHIEPSARIGQRCTIYPGVYVGPEVIIGDDCILYPNVSIYDRCVLGHRVIIHAGTVIGADGYGYATSQGIHHKIPQVGNVVLEDDVELGANCVVARGALESTRICQGTKLDALVMIGHGAEIGPHSLLVAQCGVGGSTITGHHTIMAGQSGIAGHLTIGSMVTVAGKSGVTKDIPENQVVMGIPAMPVHEARRIIAAGRRLPRIASQARELERFIAQMRGDDPATDKRQEPAEDAGQ